MIVAPGAIDCITGASDRPGRVSGGLHDGGRHVGDARLSGLWPDHDDRDGRQRHPHREFDLDAADQRQRHRLRQRAQRLPHGPGIRARRRGRDPYRGPGVPEEMRPSRQQGAGQPRGLHRQDPCRCRCTPVEGLLHHRPHRCPRRRGFRRSDRARQCSPRQRRRYGLRRGAADHGRGRGGAEAGQGALPAQRRARRQDAGDRPRGGRAHGLRHRHPARPAAGRHHLGLRPAPGRRETSRQAAADAVSGSPGKTFARFGADEWDERRTAFRDVVKAAAE